MGAGSVLTQIVPSGPVNRYDTSTIFVSKRFQWLPADFVVAADGSVQFLSYINNMHPEWHRTLYPATASLLQHTIPIFERVLAAAATPTHRVIDGSGDPWDDFDEWCKKKKEADPDFNASDDEDDFYEQWEEEREFQEPKVPEHFVAPPTPPLVTLRGRTLQVCSNYPALLRSSLKCYYIWRCRLYTFIHAQCL